MPIYHTIQASSPVPTKPSPKLPSPSTGLTKEQRFTLIQIAATTSNQSLMEAAIALLRD